MNSNYFQPSTFNLRPNVYTFVAIVTALVASHSRAQFGPAMTTVQFDNAHTGWNQNETRFNIRNANRLGKKWRVVLDADIEGAHTIKGAPLYVSGVIINGAPRDVVYVATGANRIHALDADTGNLVWEQPYSLGTPARPDNLMRVPCGSPASDIGDVIGIVSTPVIDLESGTLYAMGLTCEDSPCALGSTQLFKMGAVDIATGESRPGWPVTIAPDADILDATVTSGRPALLLANNKVYASFGGYCFDFGSYHGWVVGIDKNDPTARQVYYRTPGTDTHRGSGIWASGGIAADEDGNIYPATGNSFNWPPDPDYSDSVLRLTPDLSFSGSPSDFFTPSNWVDLNIHDYDLGSSAPLLIPRQEGSHTPNMIFVTGKFGVGHLIDRDNLGGVARGDGVRGEGVYSAWVFGEPFLGRYGAYTTAAYYRDPEGGPFIFLAGRNLQPDCGTSGGVAALKLYVDGSGNSKYRTAWCTQSMSSTMSPIVTSSPGETGILWVVERGVTSTGQPGRLFAFNAATGEQLYSSRDDPADEFSTFTPSFIHFTVIDGRVFVANFDNSLLAYGLR